MYCLTTANVKCFVTALKSFPYTLITSTTIIIVVLWSYLESVRIKRYAEAGARGVDSITA